MLAVVYTRSLSTLFVLLFVLQFAASVIAFSVSSRELFAPLPEMTSFSLASSTPYASESDAEAAPEKANDINTSALSADELSLEPDSVDWTLGGAVASVRESAPVIVSPQLASDEVINPTHRSVKVARGDTLAKIFTSLGASHLSALDTHAAMKKAVGAASALRVGETLEIGLNPEGQVSFVRRTLADGRVLTLTEDANTKYRAEVLEVIVDEERRTVSGVITTSLASAAQESRLSASVVDEFVDLFSNRIEFRRDLQPGDTFSVTFTERVNRRTGEQLRPGAITSASLNTRGSLLVAMQHTNENGDTYYFDELGNQLGNYFLRYPVQFSRISSAFSYARFHPVLKRTRPHNGVDFAAPVGTPVRSVGDGVVEVAGYKGAAGNMVKISHGERWSTAYLHLHNIARGLKPGMRVTRGQVIGTVGNTGLSTGPHLHFSLYDRDKYVDPMKTKLPAMNENVKPLPKVYLLAALESVKVEHQRVAALKSSSLPGEGDA